jgi:GT2 family glycosyltransferase
VTFDLVVATVGRTGELERLFDSLEAQTHRDFRVLVVDQNPDDRIVPLLEGRAVRLRSAPGLSRARNAALPELTAEAVAFPDDDCVYPPDLLERVAAKLERLDGVTGREPWWTTSPAPLTRDNLWNRAISFTIFLKRDVVERVGRFDERLGLPSSSGEEIDYLIRALDAGARIEYDPSIIVEHPRKQADVAARDGRSIGYLLRKHRYGPSTVARMLIRPAAAIVLHPRRARFHAETLRGRVSGYRR